MNACLFRDIDYKASPIMSLCSNEGIVVVFRRNKHADFYDADTLNRYYVLNLEHTVTCSKFIDMCTVICGTEDGKVLALNVNNFHVTSTDASISIICIDVDFTHLEVVDKHYLYCTRRNEIHEVRGNDVEIIYRSSTDIKCMLYNGQKCIVGCSQGIIRSVSGMNSVKEISTTGSINQIASVSENKFVAVTSHGECIYFDIELEVIITRVKIRDSSLNACVFKDDRVFCIGKDTRVIAYKIISNKFVKVYQREVHYLDVFCMCLDGYRIYTGGDDSTLGVLDFERERIAFTHICDELPSFGTVSDLFYANCGHYISVYIIGENGVEFEAPEIDETYPSPFKVSPDILVNCDSKTVNYRHLVKINLENFAITCAISQNKKYLAYSSAKELKLCSFYDDRNKVNIRLLRTFQPAVRVALNDNTLFYLTKKSHLHLFALDSLAESRKITVDSTRERFYVKNEFLVLPHCKQLYLLSNLSVRKLNISKSIRDVGFEKENMHFLVLSSGFMSQLYTYSVIEDRMSVSNIKGLGVRNMIPFGGKLVYNTATTVYLRSGETFYKKRLGITVFGCILSNNKLIILQDFKESIKREKALALNYMPKYGRK